LTYTEWLDALPNGTFVVLDASSVPYLVHGDALLPWSFEGYGQPIARPTTAVQVLTPHSTVRALAHGYLPDIHPTALTWVTMKTRKNAAAVPRDVDRVILERRRHASRDRLS
jgi:hypothetical protein